MAARLRSDNTHALHTHRAWDRRALGRHGGDPHGARGARVRPAWRPEHQGADALERHPGLRAPEPRQAPAPLIRDDHTGLGRVFDSRYPQPGCRGEVREYQLDCARGKRPLKVTIEEIDFVYGGGPAFGADALGG